jgi:hypothetical protein
MICSAASVASEGTTWEYRSSVMRTVACRAARTRPSDGRLRSMPGLRYSHVLAGPPQSARPGHVRRRCPLADAIDVAAAEGTTVSAWIAETAAHRLRLDAGRQGVAEWERQHGALTPDELADGLARARAMLRRQPSRTTA